MGYVLAAIFLLATVFSGGLSKSHSYINPSVCNGETGFHPVSTSPCHWYADCVLNADGTLTAFFERCLMGQLFDPLNKVCADANTFLPSDRHRRMFKREIVPTEEQKECNNQTLSCGNCTALRICSQSSTGNFTWKKDVPCKGNTRYCQDGDTPSCISRVPENCDSGFPCLTDGFFPDMNDCTVYHECYTENGELKERQIYCEAGYVYSTDLDLCKPRLSNSDCHQGRCPSGATGLFPFPMEPRFYLVCDNGVAQYVSVCPPGKEFTVNGRCEAVCRRAGRIADPDSKDCRGYIECVATTSAGPPYKQVRKACPVNQIFVSAIGSCGTGTC